ncbi:ankyrin repeat-containing domain protein [Coniella lustricola]|uniref:Ankyrin repeat-containing domain protein n=1 Tax=Coniella lustricola TaxID=2025994 RepID=A0A2T3A7S4_9PEZI|nr:ankyrin repeat-containing domain protein [Coniella lustricola]
MVSSAQRTAKLRFNDKRRLSIDSKIYKDVLEVLEGSEPKLKLKSILQRPSSESWIVRDKEETYMKWLSDEKDDEDDKKDRDDDGENELGRPRRTSKYLWIHGPKGKGKSAAVASIIKAIDNKNRELEEQKQDQSPHLLAYFFCDASPNYCTAEDVVKSLLRQLCDQQEILATYAVQFLKKQGGGGQSGSSEHKERGQAKPSIENLWLCLEEMLTEVSVDTIYFVVNNLDDLKPEPSTDKLFSFIGEDVKRMGSQSNNDTSRLHRVKMKWLISSRSHKNMQNLFDSPHVGKIDLDDAKYGDQQYEALRKYAWMKAEDLQREKKYTMAMTYLAGSIIGDRADNTKWIDLASVQLSAFPADASEVRVERMLEKVPRDFNLLLDAAWRSVLRRNDNDDKETMDIIIEILRCLVLTYEDPSEEELLVLAGFSQHSKQGKQNIRMLVDKCQPLITIRQLSEHSNITVVGFVYEDVKRHLLERARELLDVGDEWIKWQHGKMSLRCLSHIMEALRDVEFRIPDVKTQEDEEKTEAYDPNEQQQNKAEQPLPAAEPSVQNENNDDNNNDDDEDNHSLTSAVSDSTFCGPSLAQGYATQYWLRHAKDSTIDVAQIISREHLFWAPQSAQRQRWIDEYQGLTGYFDDDRHVFLGWTALHVAAAVGFANLVASLIKEGYRKEVFEYDADGKRPIHLAAYYGETENLEELLKAGSPVNDMGPENDDDSPLTMAAYNGQVDVMRKLINDWKADINAFNTISGPVLNAAIISGNTDAVELLLEHGVKLTYDEEIHNGGNDEEVAPPLAMSAYHSDIKMFTAILDGAKEKLTPSMIAEAMESAAAAGNLDILRTLLESFEHEQATFQICLESATEESNWDACLLLLQHPAAGVLDCQGLFTRAATGNEDLVELLQACWDNTHGDIPQGVLDECLYDATDKEKETTVELLLNFGADANATGKEFGTALTASAHDGTERILGLLLESGAEVNDPKGYALQQAASQGHLEIVKLLLAHKADVNQVNSLHPDLTALQAACNNGHAKVAEYLLQNGADPNLGGGLYTLPIFGAVCDGGDVLDTMLLPTNYEKHHFKLQLDVLGGPYQSSPLSTAILTLPTGRWGPLVDFGASINMADDSGKTPLMVAAAIDDADAVRVLLNRGADFMKISKQGLSTLQYAMLNGNPNCIIMILDRANSILKELQGMAESGDEYARELIEKEKSERPEIEKVEENPDEKNTNEADGQQEKHNLEVRPTDQEETAQEQARQKATAMPTRALQEECDMIDKHEHDTGEAFDLTPRSINEHDSDGDQAVVFEDHHVMRGEEEEGYGEEEQEGEENVKENDDDDDDDNDDDDYGGAENNRQYYDNEHNGYEYDQNAENGQYHNMEYNEEGEGDENYED